MENPSLVQQFDSRVSGWLSYVDQNEYITAALSLFLILYASYAVPKLPPYILALFDKPLFKLVIFFLIVYTARKNPTVAIIAAIGLLVTLQAVNKFKIDRAISGVMESNREAMGEVSVGEMTNVGPPVPSNMELEDILLSETSVPEGSIVGIREEVKSQPASESQPESLDSCVRKDQYRNSFYPQYVNMKDDAYKSRYNGSDVDGFDPNSKYASL
jgi:hypothetical protein